jgi:1-deoxy-D-xylulose-5-phosphate reductoisomerase
MNAANEIAVEAFLTEKIKFTQIPHVVEQTMQETDFSTKTDLDYLKLTDMHARTYASYYINNKLNNK